MDVPPVVGVEEPTPGDTPLLLPQLLLLGEIAPCLVKDEARDRDCGGRSYRLYRDDPVKRLVLNQLKK